MKQEKKTNKLEFCLFKINADYFTDDSSYKFTCYLKKNYIYIYICPRVDATPLTSYLAPEIRVSQGNPDKKMIFNGGHPLETQLG